MTVNNRPGQLVGRRADPSAILDGIGDPRDEIHVYACDGHGMPLSDRAARPLLVVAGVMAGALCATLVTGVLGLALGRATGEAVRSFALPSVAAATGLVALIKARSLDRECDGRQFLVRKGPHVVHMRSYLTLRARRGEPSPAVCLSVTHAIIYKGTATRGIGGAHLSCAGTYLMEVEPDKAREAVIHTDSFQGEGEVVIPDCFEAPLRDVLGDWLEDEPWAWLMPLTPRYAVIPKLPVASDGAPVPSAPPVADDARDGREAGESLGGRAGRLSMRDSKKIGRRGRLGHRGATPAV